MAATMHVDIVTPERIGFSSDAVKMVIARAIDGEIGILSDHAPLVCALDIAPLRIKQADEEIRIAVCGGFMDVKDNTVTILTQSVELATEIDVKRAELAKERAETRLQQKNNPEIDVMRAEAALRRALVRLKVAVRQ